MHFEEQMQMYVKVNMHCFKTSDAQILWNSEQRIGLEILHTKTQTCEDSCVRNWITHITIWISVIVASTLPTLFIYFLG